jgi:hypothetical protein
VVVLPCVCLYSFPCSQVPGGAYSVASAGVCMGLGGSSYLNAQV